MTGGGAPRRRLASLRVEHPVAFFSNGIGDALLTLPALRALTALFPDQLTLISPSNVWRLCFQPLRLRGHVALVLGDGAASQDGDGRIDPRVFDARSTAAAVRRCDMFVSLVPWYSKSLEELIIRLMPRTTVGLLPLHDRHPSWRDDLHAADLAFRVPQVLEPELHLEDHAQPPLIPRGAMGAAARIRSQLPRGARLLVVHPDTVTQKCWRPEGFIDALDLFLDRHTDFFVFVVGSRYPGLDVGRHADRVVPCLGLPLDVSIGLVGQADLFLGVDSSMLHAADLFRLPGVGLFGPACGGTAKWGFRFGAHQHVCGAGSVSEIQVPDVFAALDGLVGG